MSSLADCPVCSLKVSVRIASELKFKRSLSCSSLSRVILDRPASNLDR
ncbi:hypothetical protein AB7M33_003719 [Pseudomonas sp. Y3 TE3536]